MRFLLLFCLQSDLVQRQRYSYKKWRLSIKDKHEKSILVGLCNQLQLDRWIEFLSLSLALPSPLAKSNFMLEDDRSVALIFFICFLDAVRLRSGRIPTLSKTIHSKYTKSILSVQCSCWKQRFLYGDHANGWGGGYTSVTPLASCVPLVGTGPPHMYARLHDIL